MPASCPRPAAPEHDEHPSELAFSRRYRLQAVSRPLHATRGKFLRPICLPRGSTPSSVLNRQAGDGPRAGGAQRSARPSSDARSR